MEPQTGIYEFRQEEDAALLDDVKADIITYILIKKGVWCWWKGILLENDFQVLLEKTPAIPLFNLLFRDWLVILLKQMEMVFHKAETSIVCTLSFLKFLSKKSIILLHGVFVN